VRLYPAGDTLDARLATLARAIEMVREIGDTPSIALGTNCE